MSIEIGGMQVRFKCLGIAVNMLSIEVMVKAHVLQLPRREITSLHSLCHEKECWVNIGHILPGTYEHSFCVSGRFFQSGIRYIGERKNLHETVHAMIEVVRPVLVLLGKDPTIRKVVR